MKEKNYEFESSWRGAREVILLVREGKKTPILEIKYKNEEQGISFSPKMVKKEVHGMAMYRYIFFFEKGLQFHIWNFPLRRRKYITELFK